MTNLEVAVETLGFRLDLLSVFQHPLIQNQSLTPLLYQHIGLGYEEAPEKKNNMMLTKQSAKSLIFK